MATDPFEVGGNTERHPASCPKCGSTIVTKTGKFGPFLACSGYPECDWTPSKAMRQAAQEATAVLLDKALEGNVAPIALGSYILIECVNGQLFMGELLAQNSEWLVLKSAVRCGHSGPLQVDDMGYVGHSDMSVPPAFRTSGRRTRNGDILSGPMSHPFYVNTRHVVSVQFKEAK